MRFILSIIIGTVWVGGIGAVVVKKGGGVICLTQGSWLKDAY